MSALEQNQLLLRSISVQRAPVAYPMERPMSCSAIRWFAPAARRASNSMESTPLRRLSTTGHLPMQHWRCRVSSITTTGSAERGRISSGRSTTLRLSTLDLALRFRSTPTVRCNGRSRAQCSLVRLSTTASARISCRTADCFRWRTGSVAGEWRRLFRCCRLSVCIRCQQSLLPKRLFEWRVQYRQCWPMFFQ